MSDTATRTPVPSVEPATVLAGAEPVVVDLRSPAEFAEDHLPGATNQPLFDDDQRALVGTLYQRESPDAALAAGREIAAARIAELVANIGDLAGWTPPQADLSAAVHAATAEGLTALDARLQPAVADELPPRAVVLHCWRGGLRSRSVVALLRQLGLDRTFGLLGGYRAYRQRVAAELDAWSAPASFVLRGLTGVGKTLVLRELEGLRPRWTVDLEGCAGHRSSILGMVGLEPCSQKTFETRLAARLREGFPGPVVFEGESRKVGDRIVPVRLWEAMGRGVSLELQADTARRVEVLCEDYLARDENRVVLRTKLPFIEERLGKRRFGGVLVDLLDGGREEELVEILLEHYYDPLYRHSEKGRVVRAAFDASQPRRAAREIAAWIEEHGGPHCSPDRTRLS